MVRPIPKEVLIHTVIYEEFDENDRYGDKFKAPVILEFVRVNPVSSIKRSSVSDEVAYNSLMFFDCVNSTPGDVNFVKDSKITFKGEEMILDKVNPVYAFSLHHFELELI